MHAVLEVNLEAWLALIILNHLIHPCRAVALSGFSILGQVVTNRQLWVCEAQVAGLILFMVRIGQEHRGGFIKRQFAIWFRVVDLLELSGWL